MVECICRSICRIKWNGILLAEDIGELQERHQHLLKKATQSLIAKLSQTCYTVKVPKLYDFFHPVYSFTTDL